MSQEGPFTVQDALGRIAGGGSLGRDEARRTMEALLAGTASAAQIGGLLMGLRLKGEREDEVVGFVEAMRAAAVRIRPRRDPLIDMCGTGGDASGTINISTAASFVVAGAGIAVAKHGNRSASSKCGSADVLEALGVPIDLPPARVERAIEEIGLGFLFAPLYHPAMKHVGGARRELRVRTIFNLLGPLANPAGVLRQVVGVFDPSARGLLAAAFRALGSERIWVAHSLDGLDELSIAAPTAITVLDGGRLEEIRVEPEECGLRHGALDALRGGDAAENAAAIEAVLLGTRDARRDAILLNAAAGLVVAGEAADLGEGVERAAESIDGGGARKVLEGLRRFR
jgi:anthranilate phosphoribosyltransferase